MSSMYERCSKVMPAVANRATTLGIVDGEGCYVYTEDGAQDPGFCQWCCCK